MLKDKDYKALLFYAELMGQVVAKGADEQEARAKLMGAITMFMTIDGISPYMCDIIYNHVFGRYQESLIAYFEDKGEEESTK